MEIKKTLAVATTAVLTLGMFVTSAVAQEEQNIVELAQSQENLSTLVTAVTEAGLVETLSDPDANFTVFAPTNDAFSALEEGTLDALLKEENSDDLTSVLTYHVVDSEAFAADLSDGQTLTTVNGQELTVRIDGDNVFINDAQVVTADVDASNGVVHVIDAVLLPDGLSLTHDLTDTGINTTYTSVFAMFAVIFGLSGTLALAYNLSRKQ